MKLMDVLLWLIQISDVRRVLESACFHKQTIIIDFSEFYWDSVLKHGTTFMRCIFASCFDVQHGGGQGGTGVSMVALQQKG